ncbi:hypothetical protein DLH72_04100 [Candidatus Gracilibacteria bacterium]|nr:MAG: hypothetical protein DLH72_04100 [Candidatus Gracilibacteria bacterium]
MIFRSFITSKKRNLMKTEFEIKFYPVDKKELRKQIENIGGVCVLQETLMRRTIFYHPTNKDAYLRVRDEGSKITCTYKEISSENLDINSVKEIELEISDYSSMIQILKNMGIKQKSVQETKREIWKINEEIEIMIDLWPGLDYFVEIEGNSEEIVKKYSEKLGFSWEEGIFGAIDQIYKKVYGVSEDIVNSCEEITFKKLPFSIKN